MRCLTHSSLNAHRSSSVTFRFKFASLPLLSVIASISISVTLPYRVLSFKQESKKARKNEDLVYQSNLTCPIFTGSACHAMGEGKSVNCAREPHSQHAREWTKERTLAFVHSFVVASGHLNERNRHDTCSTKYRPPQRLTSR